MSDDRWRGLDRDELLGLLQRMIEIRLFEDEVMKLFASNLVRASTHLYSGQEAVAVGVCSALDEGDTMTCTYRGHGAVLAMGAPLDRSFGRDPRQGAGPVRRPRRVDAPDRPLRRSTRLVRRGRCASAVRLRHGVRLAVPRQRLGVGLLLRRGHDQHRRVPRGHEPGGDLEAAGRVRVREQPVRRVLAGGLDDAGRANRRSRRELRDAVGAGRRQRRTGHPSGRPGGV